MPHGSPFVGRRRELATLLGAARGARRQHGIAVMITGEAGIGKTRLAQEAGRRATELGFGALWARCSDADGTPPYWPWIQVLRTAEQHAPPPSVATDARQHGGPEDPDPTTVLLGDVPAVAWRNLTDPVVLRYRLFDAVRNAILRETRSRPLLLLLDDLHWADPASLALLEMVAPELPNASLMIVGTYRPSEAGAEHALTQVLGSLVRGPYIGIALEGLSRSHAKRVITAVSGAEPSPERLSDIHGQTAGNPFFLTEVAKLDTLGATFPVPETVRVAIARRLASRSHATRGMLRRAAVIGIEFEFALLRRIGDDPEESVLRAIEDALDSRWIRSTTEPERYAFTHELIRRALYEELPPGRRVRLHALIARALAGAPYQAAYERGSRLAHHAWAARSVLEDDEVLQALLSAGESALEVHAFEEARQHFGRALRLATPVPGEVEARLRLGLGRALAATSDRWSRQDAWGHIRRAAELLLEAGRHSEAAEAATDPSLTPEGVADMDETLAKLLMHVPEGSVQEVHLRARAAVAQFFSGGSYARMQGTLADALAAARRAGDAGLELRLLAYATSAAHFAVAWDDVLVNARTVVRLATRAGDLQAEAYGRYRTGFALACQGRLAAASRQAEAQLTVANRLGDRGLVGDALFLKALLAHVRGAWDDEDEALRRGLEISPHNLALRHLRAVSLSERGDTENEDTLFRALAEASRTSGPYPLRGVLAAVAVAHAACLRGGGRSVELDAWLDGEPSSVPVARGTLEVARALLATDARPDEAKGHLEALEPYAGVNFVPPLVTSRLLGRLALAAGRPELAVTYFDEAEAACRGSGLRPELGWTWADSVPALLRLRERAARRTAATRLRQARALADELGMVPLRRYVTALLERHAPVLDADLTPLTARELEVVRLVATGRRNKEVASILGISPHTVAVHLANIRAKTGTTNRTELARYAVRTGLDEG